MDPIKKRKIDDNGVFPADSDVSPTQLLTVDDARKIIEPFTHSQLLDILQNAAVCHSDVLDAVRSISDRDPSKRKLFVRGLGWDTNTERLRSLFSDYGEVEEGIVILDKATGKSKGYGFVTFRHVDGALLALKEPSKKIDGRMTVTQLASAGVQNPNPAANLPALDSSARKIYVGNVPYDMAAERLLSHFLSYGEVEEGPLGFDKATGKSKGYALFVYKTAEGANASLVDPIKTVDGHQLNCKLAIDGKRGKPGLPVPAEAQGNGIGMMQQQQSQYGGFSGHYPPLNSSMGGTIAQQPSLGVSGGGGGGGGGYGSGIGGPYGGATQYGGPGSTGYGGLSGAGRGSSMYGFPPSSTGMPSSGYPESSNYGYPSQHQQTAGISPAPRVPPGGMYQGGGPPQYI